MSLGLYVPATDAHVLFADRLQLSVLYGEGIEDIGFSDTTKFLIGPHYEHAAVFSSSKADRFLEEASIITDSCFTLEDLTFDMSDSRLLLAQPSGVHMYGYEGIRPRFSIDSVGFGTEFIMPDVERLKRYTNSELDYALEFGYETMKRANERSGILDGIEFVVIGEHGATHAILEYADLDKDPEAAKQELERYVELPIR